MTDRDDDLAERVADLEDALADLRTELREPPRGPLGLPRPPTPRELLRLTERRAIPAAIAVLEANVRALELLQGALRLTDPERAARDGATGTRDRAERAGQAVMDRLDDALADLQAEIEEGDLPADGEARDILRDARRLTGEIDDRLAAADGSRDGTDTAPTADGSADAGDGTGDDGATGVEIDVEGELQSIKDDLDGDDAGPDGPEDGADGRDGDEAADPEDGRDGDDGPGRE